MRRFSEDGIDVMLDDVDQISYFTETEGSRLASSTVLTSGTSVDPGSDILEHEKNDHNFTLAHQCEEEHKQLSERLIHMHQVNAASECFLPYSQVIDLLFSFSSQKESEMYLKRCLRDRHEIHYAILSQNYVTLAFALNSGHRESINELDTLGRTALHLALLTADSLAVQLLLSFPVVSRFLPYKKNEESDSSLPYLDDEEKNHKLNPFVEVDFPSLFFHFGVLPVFHLPLAACVATQNDSTRNHVLMTYTLLLGYATVARCVLNDMARPPFESNCYRTFVDACGWDIMSSDPIHQMMVDRFRECLDSLFFATETSDKDDLWSINAQDDQGSTALHLACSLGNRVVAELLVNEGASPHVADFRGFFPIHRAIDSHSEEIFCFLLKKSLAKSAEAQEFFKRHNTEEKEQITVMSLMKHCILRGSWNCLCRLTSDPVYLESPLSSSDYEALVDFARICGYFHEFEKILYNVSSPVLNSLPVLECPRLKIFTSETCFEHIPLPHHGDLTALKRLKLFLKYPENPSRLFCLVSKDSGILHSPCFRDVEWCWNSAPAPLADILRVHDWNYIHLLLTRLKSTIDENVSTPADIKENNHCCTTQDIIEKRFISLDADTVLTPGSWDAARTAAGCALAAVDAVCSGSTRTAFCAIRPPGHHIGTFGPCQPPSSNPVHESLVSPEFEEDWLHGSQGFCLLNNVAIAAAYARYRYAERGIRRIAIVDFDIHHGNGTQQIVMNLRPRQRKLKLNLCGQLPGMQLDINYMTEFWKPWLDDTDADEVFFVSIHGFGERFYPNTGGEEFTSKHPNIRNIHLPPFVTREEFRSSFLERLLMPLLAFQPDLLILSSGFDGHIHDLVNDLFAPCCEWDFFWLTRLLVAVANDCCKGRIVSILEGGYNSKAGPLSPLAQSVAYHVQALLQTSPLLSLQGAKVLEQSVIFQSIPLHRIATPPRRRKRAAAVRALALLNQLESASDGKYNESKNHS